MKATCVVIPTGAAYEGRQGFTYLTGLNGATAQSQGICMAVVDLPAGARARTHLHQGVETAVYVLEGVVDMYFGERLGDHLVARAEEFVYVPADMPHRVMNRSDASARALVAHSSPDDQAGIIMRPELDAIHG